MQTSLVAGLLKLLSCAPMFVKEACPVVWLRLRLYQLRLQVRRIKARYCAQDACSILHSAGNDADGVTIQSATPGPASRWQLLCTHVSP